MASELRYRRSMSKTGLRALAECYGFEAGEAEKFKRAGQRFFELLGETFAGLSARRAKLLGAPALTIETYAEFCSASAPQHTAVLSWAGATRLAFRIDQELVLALINGVLGRSRLTSATAPADDAAVLTSTEARIADAALRNALCATAAQLSSALLGETAEAPAVRLSAAPGLIPDTFDPVQKMAVIEARYSINGATGRLAVGLPMEAILEGRTGRPHPALRLARDDERRRMREELGEARVALAAVLGAVELPFTTLEALRPGSIIALGGLRARAPQVELRAGAQRLCAGTVIAERGWYRFLVQPEGGSN